MEIRIAQQLPILFLYTRKWTGFAIGWYWYVDSHRLMCDIYGKWRCSDDIIRSAFFSFLSVDHFKCIRLLFVRALFVCIKLFNFSNWVSFIFKSISRLNIELIGFSSPLRPINRMDIRCFLFHCVKTNPLKTKCDLFVIDFICIFIENKIPLKFMKLFSTPKKKPIIKLFFDSNRIFLLYFQVRK